MYRWPNGEDFTETANSSCNPKLDRHCYKTLKYPPRDTDSTCAYSNLSFPYEREGFRRFWEEIEVDFHSDGRLAGVKSFGTKLSSGYAGAGMVGVGHVPIGPMPPRTLHEMTRRLR